MRTNQPLSLFIGGEVNELAEERHKIQAALSGLPIFCSLKEDVGARTESTRSTYLAEVTACDVYIGLFWLIYNPHAIEEFKFAFNHHKPCLIYQKEVNIDRRDRKLKAFLRDIKQNVNPKNLTPYLDDNNPKNLTPYLYKNLEQLTEQIKKDILRLLTERFRNISSPPPFIPKAYTSTNISIYAAKGIKSDKMKYLKKSVLQYRTVMETTIDESLEVAYTDSLNPSLLVETIKTLLTADTTIEQQTMPRRSAPTESEVIKTLTTIEAKTDLDRNAPLAPALSKIIDEINLSRQQVRQTSNPPNADLPDDKKQAEKYIESSNTISFNNINEINPVKYDTSENRQDNIKDALADYNSSLPFHLNEQDNSDEDFHRVEI